MEQSEMPFPKKSGAGKGSAPLAITACYKVRQVTCDYLHFFCLFFVKFPGVPVSLIKSYLCALSET